MSVLASILAAKQAKGFSESERRIYICLVCILTGQAYNVVNELLRWLDCYQFVLHKDRTDSEELINLLWQKLNPKTSFEVYKFYISLDSIRWRLTSKEQEILTKILLDNPNL